MRRRRAFVTAIALLVLAPTLYARGKKAAPTEPGTYNAWGQDIDHIEILKTFKITERVGFELRGEFFNITNNQNFDTPSQNRNVTTQNGIN